MIQLLAGFHASIWHIFRSHVLDSRNQLHDEMLPLWFNFWRCHCGYSALQKNDFVTLDLHTHYSLTPNPSDSSHIHLLYVGFTALISSLAESTNSVETYSQPFRRRNRFQHYNCKGTCRGKTCKMKWRNPNAMPKSSTELISNTYTFF